MNKVALSLIVLFFLPAAILAQEDSTRTGRKYGIDLRWDPNAQYYNAAVAGFSITKGKHTLVIGPDLWLGSPSGGYKWKRAGAELMYKLHPNPPGKRFDLFFFYNVAFAHIKKSREGSSGFGYPSHVSSPYTYLTTYVTIMNNIGYGFRTKIAEGLYFHTGFGAGIGVSKENARLDVPLYPSGSYDTKGKFSDQGDFSVVFDAGVSFDFRKKKSR